MRACSICSRSYVTTADIALCERDHYRRVFIAAREIIRKAPRQGLEVPPELWNDLMVSRTA